MGAAVPCCSPPSAEEEAPFPRNPEEGGEFVERGCTDQWCLGIFVVFLGLMACEVFYAISQGANPKRLTHGVDYNGNICGVDVPEQWVYWCGSTERNGEFPAYIMHDSTVCVSACPTNGLKKIPCLMKAYHNVTQVSGGQLALPGGMTPNQQTMTWIITQSITNQSSYPTEPYAGKFCMPARRDNSTLRDDIVNGPYAFHYRAGAAFGSVKRAAPLLILVALLAVFLGYLFLFCLGHCAGMVIFTVMSLSVILLWAAGLFFCWAIFVSGEDETSWYQRSNPMFRTMVGWEARGTSIVVGLGLFALSACLGCVICKTYEIIDESVGVIQAACECIGQECSLRVLPLVQTAGVVVLIFVLLIVGLPWVAALGYLDKENISINGALIEGLDHRYKRTDWQRALLLFYLFGCWWVAEFFISFGQFVVSYIVVLWYFQPVTEEESDELPEELKELTKKNRARIRQVAVRVSGVDGNYMPRKGVVTKNEGGGKYLLVPVEDEEEEGIGPDELDAIDYVKEPVACAGQKGACVGFWHHMGSMAYGCLLIAVCRPFRMFSGCLSGFERPSEEPEEEEEEDGRKFYEMPDLGSGGFDTWLMFCNLVSLCFDSIFGGYSKNTYTEIVLTGDDFSAAAERAIEFLTEAGGSVATLAGACFVYEVFGVLCITVICVFAFLWCATSWSVFADEASDWYIPNLFWGTLFAAAVSALTAFEFMQIFNHTADTLLYAFAYNRELAKEREEFYPGKYCPGCLRDMMQPYELEPGGEDEIHAHGTAAQFIMRAGFDYPIRAMWNHGWGGGRNIMESQSSADVFVPECSEGGLGEGGNYSAREFSFRSYGS